jgi:3-methyladenine DNA glycosylase Tag
MMSRAFETYPAPDPLMLVYYDEEYSVNEKDEYYPLVWEMLIEEFQQAGRICMAEQCKRKMERYNIEFEITPLNPRRELSFEK